LKPYKARGETGKEQKRILFLMERMKRDQKEIDNISNKLFNHSLGHKNGRLYDWIY